jgi:hypothetical protein
MKAYGVVEIQLHSFLTSTLDPVEWSGSHSGRFTPGVRFSSNKISLDLILHSLMYLKGGDSKEQWAVGARCVTSAYNARNIYIYIYIYVVCNTDRTVMAVNLSCCKDFRNNGFCVR